MPLLPKYRSFRVDTDVRVASLATFHASSSEVLFLIQPSYNFDRRLLLIYNTTFILARLSRSTSERGEAPTDCRVGW
jgi:hypothetical protein